MCCKIQPIQYLTKTREYSIITVPQEDTEAPPSQWNILSLFRGRKTPNTQDDDGCKSPISLQCRIYILIFAIIYLFAIVYFEGFHRSIKYCC